jgi:lysophospholipase L1-like esterase
MKSRVALLVIVLALGDTALAQRGAEHWVGTWAAAEVGRPRTPPTPLPSPPGQPPPATPAPFVQFDNQTLRQIVRTSIGGSRVRIVLSNIFGTAPLSIGAAHIALRDKESAIVPQSDRALAFSGSPEVRIPAGAMIVSDPVELAVPPLGDVAVDLYLPGRTDAPSPVTMHTGASQTSYVSAAGNHAGEPVLTAFTKSQSWFLIARVEVMSTAGAVVAFGDSITDGARSTADTNNRWPDQLARRLSASNLAKLAVLNAGIGGNRLLTDGVYSSGVNALARFEHQALEQTGVTHVIVLEGINDIGYALHDAAPGGAELIAAHRQMIERAHTRGLKIFGATLTPFEGSARFSVEGEAKREALNEWIRTSKVYDGVVDFDVATRDPNQPKRFKAEFDSGDHLHPNDAGYTAMGNAIDLSLFQPGKTK